jgi:hypothetical protein
LVDILKVRVNVDFNTGDCYDGAIVEKPCTDERTQLFYPCKDIADKNKQKSKVTPKKSLT